jgi:hypothetical protein
MMRIATVFAFAAAVAQIEMVHVQGMKLTLTKMATEEEAKWMRMKFPEIVDALTSEFRYEQGKNAAEVITDTAACLGIETYPGQALKELGRECLKVIYGSPAATISEPRQCVTGGDADPNEAGRSAATNEPELGQRQLDTQTQPTVPPIAESAHTGSTTPKPKSYFKERLDKINSTDVDYYYSHMVSGFFGSSNSRQLRTLQTDILRFPIMTAIWQIIKMAFIPIILIVIFSVFAAVKMGSNGA